MMYGTAVLAASANSNSMQEFYDQGNWLTVGTTLGGGLWGGYSGYSMFKAQQYTSRGSTGRTKPHNLKEKLAMEQVKANPLDGAIQLPTQMTDPRWSGKEGWVKMANNVNGVEIHFVHKKVLYLFDDFKFK